MEDPSQPAPPTPTGPPRRGAASRARLVVAPAAGALGVVWIAQGTGRLGGSFMTGQSRWTLIGALVLIGGIVLAAVEVRSRRSR